MWRHISLSVGRAATTTFSRHQTFLTAAYQCTDTWNSRLAAPIVGGIRPEQFYFDLDQQFQQTGKCSAIDIDLFANCLNKAGYHDEIADLLHRQRSTDETTSVLSSTGHALIRYYLDCGNVDELFAILNDRLSYGVFLDSYTANLMLDRFIRAKDFTNATRVGTLMMLQEDLSNPITRSMSLFASWKFLQQPIQSFDTAVGASEESSTTTVAAPPAVAPSKKKREEVRVRVGYLRNPFYDDHFDLTDCNHLVGKTLVMIAAESDESMGPSITLLGLFYRGKYEQAMTVLHKDGGKYVHKDVIDHILSHLEKVVPVDGNADDLKLFTEAINKMSVTAVVSDNFEKSICKMVEEAVAENQKNDIDEQIKVSLFISHILIR